MWLKFDGKKAVIKLEGWKKFKRLGEFTLDVWMHIIEDNGKLYIEYPDQKQQW